MNARLQMKLLQVRPVQVPALERYPALAPLRLLGDDLDAIIQHTERPMRGILRLLWSGTPDHKALPAQPSADDRLRRYRDAALLHPLPCAPAVAARREAVGEILLDAWQRGLRPNLRRAQALIGLPIQRQQAC